MIVYIAMFMLLAFCGGFVTGFYLGVEEYFHNDRRDKHE